MAYAKPKTAVPVLSEKDRQAALVKAMETRQRNKELLDKVRNGTVSFEAAINDPGYDRIHVRNLLVAISGIGKAKATRMMQDAGIAENRRVKGLGCRQKEHLISYLNAKKG